MIGDAAAEQPVQWVENLVNSKVSQESTADHFATVEDSVNFEDHMVSTSLILL